MSRANRFIVGVFFGYVNQMLVMAVGLWLTPFLLHRIGQQDYGLWLVGSQVMLYLALLDLGIVALLPRETAFATGREKVSAGESEVSTVVGKTTRLVMWQMPLVILAATVSWFLLPASWAGLRYPIGLALITFVVTFPLRIFGAVLRGLQDLAFLGRVTLFSFLLSTTLTIGLVILGFGLYALSIGWAVSQLFSAVAGWLRLRAKHPTALPKVIPPLKRSGARVMIKQGFWVTISQVSVMLVSGTDILLIGTIFGPAAVVPYMCTGKLIGVLSSQPQMIVEMAGPALSQMRASESRLRISQVCIALSQAMLMLSSAIVCVVLVINQGFVTRWVGANLFGGQLLSLFFLLSMLLRHWNQSMAYTIFYFGYERRVAVVGLADGIVTTIASVILIYFIGAKGAPLGSIIGVCLINIPSNLTALLRESGITVQEFLRSLWPLFWRLALLVTGAGAIAKLWTPHDYFELATAAVVMTLAFVALMLPVALRPPLGAYITPKLGMLRGLVVGRLRHGDVG